MRTMADLPERDRDGIVLAPPFEVDVALTLLPFRCGRHDPTFALAGGVVWRALATADGPATVRVAPLDARSIEAVAWGPGRHAALARVPAMLGFADDDRGFVAHHDVVRRARRRFCGVRLGRGGNLVEALVPTVLEQKVTSAEAHRSWAALVQRYGAPAPGPGPVRLAPTAESLGELPYTAWHAVGVERRRAETIRRLCARTARLRALEREPPEEARRVLEHFPGVGPWTSNSVTLLSHGDPDAVVVGDYHLPHLVAFTLTGQRRGSDEDMLRHLEPYRGQRARAMRLLSLGGTYPPRRAPRAPSRSIRSI
jgi:3-methyladenine DNA glycosylase/8-oxoguanine DNA glycosylase